MPVLPRLARCAPVRRCQQLKRRVGGLRLAVCGAGLLAVLWLLASGTSTVIDYVNPPPGPSVLVVLAFGATDESDPATPMCRENMQYMIEHLLVPPTCCTSKRVDFVINVVDDTPLTPGLEAILDAQREGGAAAARYANLRIQHARNMNDLCAMSHVWRGTSLRSDAMPLDEHDVHAPPYPYDADAWLHVRPLLPQYDYYMATNCGVRGPYVAGCSPADRHAATSTPDACASWVDVFTAKLRECDAHVVGASINCERAPHVQSTALMVTAEAEPVVRSAFARACTAGHGRLDTIVWGEVGASRLAVEAGFNLASLQPQYAGVDWRKYDPDAADPVFSQCLRGANPQGCAVRNDRERLGCRGVDPYERVFVKTGGDPLRRGVAPPWVVECVRSLEAGKSGMCPVGHRPR